MGLSGVLEESDQISRSDNHVSAHGVSRLMPVAVGADDTQANLNSFLQQAPDDFNMTLYDAQCGSMRAMLVVAQCYGLGHGCVRDKAIALRWLKRVRCQQIGGSEKAFAQAKKVIALGDKVLAFEQQEKYTIDGLSMQERLERYANAASGRLSIAFDDIMRQMQTLAANGSWTAWDFVSAYSMMKDAFQALDRGFLEKGLELVYVAHTYWGALDIPKEKLAQLCKVAQQILTNEPDHEHALFALGISTSKPVTFWLHCTILYPNNGIFHGYLGSAYATLGQLEGAFRSFTQALIFVNKASTQQLVWMYERASCLRLLYASDLVKISRVIDAYQAFLSKAPRDHINYPQACYSLSLLYVAVGDISNANAASHSGLKAETIRLPCLLPLNSTSKQKALKSRKECGDDVSKRIAPKVNHPTLFHAPGQTRKWYADVWHFSRRLYQLP